MPPNSQQTYQRDQYKFTRRGFFEDLRKSTIFLDKRQKKIGLILFYKQASNDLDTTLFINNP